jgi:hypothetical protein
VIPNLKKEKKKKKKEKEKEGVVAYRKFVLFYVVLNISKLMLHATPSGGGKLN